VGGLAVDRHGGGLALVLAQPRDGGWVYVGASALDGVDEALIRSRSSPRTVMARRCDPSRYAIDAAQ
jgi:hypothetical protein